MKRGLLALALLALLTGIASAQSTPPAVPHWPDDFAFAGTSTLAWAPYPNDAFGATVGDFKFGKGLAVKAEPDGTVTIYAGSWNPQVVLRWKARPAADGTFTGNAGFARVVGAVPYTGELIGLYLIGDDLYASSNSTYDGTPATAPTLGKASLDATGKTVAKGRWSFASRSDKMTMGGLTSVPEWWRAQYQQTCDTLAGWGGYWSVIATGPVSMGPAATCFSLPTDEATAGASLPNVPVLGFPFSGSLTTWTPATHRDDIDYNQRYGWGWWPATVPSGFGYWNPGDALYQGCTWVDTHAVSGLVCVPLLQEGCNWYGSNAIPAVPPVCNATPGKAAALNSNRQRPWVFIYDPADLGAVAQGRQPQTSVQPASQVPFAPPGLTLPFPGLPNINHIIAGVTYEPTLKLLAVLVRDSTTLSSRPSIYWFKVRDAVPVPFTVLRTRTTTTTEALTVRALSPEDALAFAKAAAEGWMPDSTHATPDEYVIEKPQ